MDNENDRASPMSNEGVAENTPVMDVTPPLTEEDHAIEPVPPDPQPLGPSPWLMMQLLARGTLNTLRQSITTPATTPNVSEATNSPLNPNPQSIPTPVTSTNNTTNSPNLSLTQRAVASSVPGPPLLIRAPAPRPISVQGPRPRLQGNRLTRPSRNATTALSNRGRGMARTPAVFSPPPTAADIGKRYPWEKDQPGKCTAWMCPLEGSVTDDSPECLLCFQKVPSKSMLPCHECKNTACVVCYIRVCSSAAWDQNQYHDLSAMQTPVSCPFCRTAFTPVQLDQLRDWFGLHHDSFPFRLFPPRPRLPMRGGAGRGWGIWRPPSVLSASTLSSGQHRPLIPPQNEANTVQMGAITINLDEQRHLMEMIRRRNAVVFPNIPQIRPPMLAIEASTSTSSSAIISSQVSLSDSSINIDLNIPNCVEFLFSAPMLDSTQSTSMLTVVESTSLVEPLRSHAQMSLSSDNTESNSSESASESESQTAQSVKSWSL